MIEAEGVSLRRDGRFLVDEVSVAIRPGSLTAVLGPNGAGKSTLVRLLSGEITPNHGRVSLDGRDLKQWSRQDLARRRAVLSQSVALTFPLSVTEVVMLGRAPHRARTTRTVDQAAVEAALRAADVFHLAGRSYPTLSGGEQQRVQFARVLAQLEETDDSGPRYLILDEPTSSLDIHHQARLLGLAGTLARKGWGILAVLHDPNLAAVHADTIVLLRGGRILASGDPWNVMTQEKLTATFDHPVLVSRRTDLDRPLVVPTA